ncbi:alpha/beta hydrolase family esterase [Actinoplanes rectilineatus]|uniref:alpha/beta hydrolase family esterase n=1 Tax=Actinoplanes rectilineatus TaxID=113571 RepID=UPI0005F2A6E1|nr:hypothetical protein [Actinoplanes rectilineatus]
MQTHQTIEVGGLTRTYTLITPDGGHDRLVLVLHGSGQTAATHRTFTGNAFDGLRRSAVAYLDGIGRQWNDARKQSRAKARIRGIDDVGFAAAVAHRHGTGLPVYAVGYSNGGGLVIRLLHERPDVVAGAVVVAAQQPAADNFLVPGLPVVPRPVLLIHGTKDRIVPYAGGEMAKWAQIAFRSGGAMLSSPQTAAYFAGRNGITTPPQTADLPASAPGRTSVSRTDYRQEGRPPVTLYTVHGGGHTIPGPVDSPALMGRTGHDIHTAAAIEEFLGF